MLSGIVISQSGIDIKDAADTQKVLDSRWKFLSIEKEERVSVSHTFSSSGAKTLKLIDHNLGYLPAFSQEIHSWTGGASLTFVADKISVYAVLTAPSAMTQNLDITVSVYDCDITTEYEAPIQTPSPDTPSNESTVGAWVTLDSAGVRGIYSKNLNDFSLNTQSKALSIQRHGLKETSDGYLEITHNFGAPPMFMVARYFINGYNGATLVSSELGEVDLIATINSTEGTGMVSKTSLRLTGAQYALIGTFAYILLKDPLDVAL